MVNGHGISFTCKASSWDEVKAHADLNDEYVKRLTTQLLDNNVIYDCGDVYSLPYDPQNPCTTEFADDFYSMLKEIGYICFLYVREDQSVWLVDSQGYNYMKYLARVTLGATQDMLAIWRGLK